RDGHGAEHLEARRLRRPARRARCLRRDLELPADQQPGERLQPDADPRHGVEALASPAFRGRREDDRFLTGKGRYTADASLPGQLYAAFRRSEVAAARIRSIDTTAALRHAG